MTEKLPDNFGKRFGRFRIAADLVERAPAAVMAVLSQTLVVKAESRYWANDIEYVALSAAFAPVPNGEEAPFYTPTIQQLGPNKYHVTWGRM